MNPNRTVRSIYTTDDLWEEVQNASKREGVSLSAVVSRAIQQYFATKVTRSSWDTDDESSWYEPTKFYTYSEDKKGHSIQIRMWVPKNLAGQIARVVNSGLVPEYRSAQDFYRDAMFHRAHIVGEWIDDGELKAELGMAILIAEEDEIAQMKKDSETLIARLRENLEEAWNRGDYEWMEQHISGRLEKANSIPEQFRGEFVLVLKAYKAKLAGVQSGKVKRMIRQRAETANG